MNKEVEKYMQEEGWIIECISPLEIRHEDGSFASGQAADILFEHYTNELFYFKHSD